MSWIQSSTLVLKKSKFKAFIIPIKTNNEIPQLLKEVYTLDKHLKTASHPTMYAWKTADSNSNSSKITKLQNVNQGFNDNNEGGSGQRILGLIDRIKLFNILVIVSRWYGGTPLGPARFKCISDVAMEAVKNGGYFNSNGGNNKSYTDCLKINK